MTASSKTRTILCLANRAIRHISRLVGWILAPGARRGASGLTRPIHRVGPLFFTARLSHPLVALFYAQRRRLRLFCTFHSPTGCRWPLPGYSNTPGTMTMSKVPRLPGTLASIRRGTYSAIAAGCCLGSALRPTTKIEAAGIQS